MMSRRHLEVTSRFIFMETVDVKLSAVFSLFDCFCLRFICLFRDKLTPRSLCLVAMETEQKPMILTGFRFVAQPITVQDVLGNTSETV